jgi:sugar phosphate isomerase/epimerase
MKRLTRRSFLKDGALGTLALSAAAGWASPAKANPLGLPVGMQLYTVRQELARDFDGTLRQVADIGYREVEMAGFYSKTPAEILRSMRSVGLKVISAHYSLEELQQDLSGKMAFAKELGLQYMICPGITSPHPQAHPSKQWNFTLDDWKWNAEQFNKVGAETKKAGIQFGYHNHYHDFERIDGKIPYNEMLEWCDPRFVKFEIDVGWMVYSGFDPIHYMTRYPGRFPELHIKGVKVGSKPFVSLHPGGFPTAELGRDDKVNWKRVFAVARTAGVRHYYLEQESFPDMPLMEALKVDYDYLHSLKA